MVYETSEEIARITMQDFSCLRVKEVGQIMGFSPNLYCSTRAVWGHSWELAAVLGEVEKRPKGGAVV